jgi:hypothetical protein
MPLLKEAVMIAPEDRNRLQVGDPVKLKDSDLDLRGSVWALRTGRYLLVRWEDECRSTHSETALELDYSRSPVLIPLDGRPEDGQAADDQAA